LGVSIAARTAARERVLQVLFGLLFTGNDWEPELEETFETDPADGEVKKYSRLLLSGIDEHRGELKARIDAALSGWTAERVGRIEMALLHLGAFEILYLDDVPDKAAINEVLELAKRYAPDGATKFLNGVLDRLMHERDSEPAAGPAE